MCYFLKKRFAKHDVNEEQRMDHRNDVNKNSFILLRTRSTVWICIWKSAIILPSLARYSREKIVTYIFYRKQIFIESVKNRLICKFRLFSTYNTMNFSIFGGKILLFLMFAILIEECARHIIFWYLLDKFIEVSNWTNGQLKYLSVI